VSSSPTETLIDVLLPAMGTSITEGTLIEWSKAVGDTVAADETLCEVSTDKVDTEIPSPAAGVVAEILVSVGETVEAGTVIARLAVEGAHLVRPATTEPNGSPSPNGERPRRYSPVVTRMARVHDLDLALIAGTGSGGRVTKKDVLAHLERDPEARPLHSESPYRPQPGPPGMEAAPLTTAPDASDLGGRAEPLSRMRQSIGTAMRRSQETTATCHTVVECDMSPVETRRQELGVTALPLVSRAVVETLREYPDLNATLEGSTVTRYDRVHLGIAVSLGDDGLIVPVIHDAQELSPEGLGRRIKDLARRARDKQLSPDDVRGATFTISNPGASGAVFATPIINVPQVAILDLEAIVRRSVVVADEDGYESIAIRPMVNLILGWDHRALDGLYAAGFLTALRQRLESRP
jgi:pyruvate/2-oxoglutarate dehydrogenase complex dihydrolipoamide acyltransferase (E2) component